MKKNNLKKMYILLTTLFAIIVTFLFILIGFKNTNKKTVKKVQEKVNIKKDNIKPEITLKGKKEIVLVKNSIYEEAGVEATDNIDGDITSKVKIKNNVDLTKSGEYYIIYSIEDSSKNKIEVKRKVTVVDVDNPDTDGISVLMYHYFYDDINGEIGKDNNYLAKSKFEEQLKYLKENNYYFPTMKEISLYLDNKLILPEKSVVITMDDGHEDNYRIAYPLAVEYEIPITMFVVTSWTNPQDNLQKEMVKTGYVSLQSHTHDMHRSGCSNIGHGGIIQCIDYNDGINDLKKSSELLGNSDSVAYPFGDNTELSQKIVSDAGYLLAFTTTYGKVKPGLNKLSLPRVRINSGISLNSFIDSL